MARTPELAGAVGATRFWRLVAQRGESECWEWLGDRVEGYGYTSWCGKRYGAHELALTFATGEVRREGQHTCHSCHNPGCCNPRHLRFDSPASNIADSVTAGRNVRGTRNPTARFTDEQVEELRRRRANGETVRALAAEVGTSPGTISRICTGKRWTHAAGPVVLPYERITNGQG